MLIERIKNADILLYLVCIVKHNIIQWLQCFNIGQYFSRITIKIKR